MQRVNHVRFGRDEERLRLDERRDVFAHRLGAADEVRMFENVHRTFRVSDDATAGIVPFGSQHVGDAEDLVNHARTGPQNHLAAGDLRQIPAEMLIGHKQNFLVGRNAVDDLASVSTGDDPIDEALHPRRRIDVRHRLEVPPFGPQLLLELRQFLRLTAIGQRAPRLHVRQQHALRWAEHLGGLGHEVDAAEDDRRGRHLCGVACQLQAVAGEIGDVLNIPIHVKVSEDRRVLFLLQPFDLVHQIERIFLDGGSLSQNRQCGRHDEFLVAHAARVRVLGAL